MNQVQVLDKFLRISLHTEESAFLPTAGNQSRRKKFLKSIPEEYCSENLCHIGAAFFYYEFIQKSRAGPLYYLPIA